MGACLSSSSSSSSSSDRHSKQQSAANVVSINGELRQYSLPVTVSQVLDSETSSSPDSFFLCNSDLLFFEDYIPSLQPQHLLDPAQFYFVLPTTKLQHRLSATDMAALAVKATAAIEKINGGGRRNKKKKARISPVLVVDDQDPPSDCHKNQIYNNNESKVSASGLGFGVSRSGSMRRAKLAVRSFRMRLTTINEGSVLPLS